MLATDGQIIGAEPAQLEAITADMFELDHVRPEDRSFVLDSWARSFWRSQTARNMGASDFWEAIRFVSESLIVSCRVVVLRPAGSAYRIAGWACAEPERGELHYVYVKGPYRRVGLATRMLREFGELTAYTHKRKPQTRFLDRLGLTYDGRFWEDV